MDEFVSVECAFCGERTRKHRASEQGLAWVNGLYLSHLVESHWDQLVKAREERMATNTSPRSFTAWQRL